VCADVFANTAGALMHTGAHDGLAELLAGETSLAAALQRPAGIKGLRVLGPGRDPDRADALLQTSSPRKLVEELLANASFVVIEAPATAESSDAQTLATVAEMAILVVDAGHTTGREVIDACAQFESMHTPVLGAVFATFGRDREADVSDGNAGGEQVPATAQVADRTPGPAASDGVAAVRDQALVPPHLRGRPRP
jgi:Mrp family chromosome partitioning ATPase